MDSAANASPIIRPKGQRKTQDPCDGCFLHRERCICDAIPLLALRTKLTLVIHAKEVKRTTNTGLLATRALQNSDVWIRGLRDEPARLRPLVTPGYRSLLFFPGETAIELTEELVQSSPLPTQLIVPDGNWRQASKVQSREPALAGLPRVMIRAPNTEKLRLWTESSTEGMATLQAIAHAMGVIEGADVKEKLLTLYRLKLERTLAGRGLA